MSDGSIQGNLPSEPRIVRDPSWYDKPEPGWECYHCDEPVNEDDRCERCDLSLCDADWCRLRHMEWHAEKGEAV